MGLLDDGVNLIDVFKGINAIPCPYSLIEDSKADLQEQPFVQNTNDEIKNLSFLLIYFDSSFYSLD